MKKTHKKVFGCAGLALVAATTVFAATLPNPEASAISTLTDTVTVRVLAEVPDVNFVIPNRNATVIDANQQILINYESVDVVTIGLKHTSLDGTVTDVPDFAVLSPNYVAGEATIPVNLSLYGYGLFEFSVTGTGEYGVFDADTITINYEPLSSDLEEKDDGSVAIGIDYGTPTASRVAVRVRKKDSSEVLWGTTVTPPTNSVVIPFDTIDGLETGDYEIDVIAYDENGDIIYTKVYEHYLEVVPIPNTGSFLGNLNITKEDYMITGAVVFSILAIIGVLSIVKSRSKRR